jgi:hypothetical protein
MGRSRLRWATVGVCTDPCAAVGPDSIVAAAPDSGHAGDDGGAFVLGQAIEDEIATSGTF